jgi:carbamoyltransferase
VVHVDNTARPQFIKRTTNPLYFDIVQEFYKRTGIPALINTSFNIHEEPIICTPEDAVRTFLVGKFDMLVLEKYIVEP